MDVKQQNNLQTNNAKFGIAMTFLTLVDEIKTGLENTQLFLQTKLCESKSNLS